MAWPRQQHTWKPHVCLRACPHTKSLLLLSPWKCHGHTKVHPYEKHFEIVHRGGVSRRHQQPIYWIVTKCSFPCCQTKQLIENFRKVFDNRTRTVAPAIWKQKTTQTNSCALMRCGDAPTDRLLLLSILHLCHSGFMSLHCLFIVSSNPPWGPEDPNLLSICRGWLRHSTSHGHMGHMGHMGHSKCPSREPRHPRWLAFECLDLACLKRCHRPNTTQAKATQPTHKQHMDKWPETQPVPNCHGQNGQTLHTKTSPHWRCFCFLLRIQRAGLEAQSKYINMKRKAHLRFASDLSALWVVEVLNLCSKVCVAFDQHEVVLLWDVIS